MSPIKKENKNSYPNNWREISRRIKNRAGWRCECEGECGSDHLDERPETGRCTLRHGEVRLHNPTGRGVVLTVAHLNHDPSDNEDHNLRAYCEGCHLRYDAGLHRKNASHTRALKNNEGQEVLF